MITSTRRENDMYVSCKCREWTITEGDQQNVFAKPTGTHAVHDCQDITVFQDDRGLTRYFGIK
jgi:hypothetical protein